MKFEFLAEAAVVRLRLGYRPDEQSISFLYQFPMIDDLRSLINVDDLKWLMDMVENESGLVPRLYLALLRPHSRRKEVQEFLRSRWEGAEPDFRACLMWRMLDDPKLPLRWHRRIFLFVQENWETFRQEVVNFNKTLELAIVHSLDRLADPSYPASKKWVYLCVVAAMCDDAGAARGFVEMGKSMGDKFAQEVAEALLGRFT